MNYFTSTSVAPLRGNWNQEYGSEHNSNFHQLLLLRAEEDPKIVEWLKRKQCKFTSPEIQNEMLQVFFTFNVLFIKQFDFC